MTEYLEDIFDKWGEEHSYEYFLASSDGVLLNKQTLEEIYFDTPQEAIEYIKRL